MNINQRPMAGLGAHRASRDAAISHRRLGLQRHLKGSGCGPGFSLSVSAAASVSRTETGRLGVLPRVRQPGVRELSICLHFSDEQEAACFVALQVSGGQVFDLLMGAASAPLLRVLEVRCLDPLSDMEE